jgi:hypothetical protein
VLHRVVRVALMLAVAFVIDFFRHAYLLSIELKRLPIQANSANVPAM